MTMPPRFRRFALTAHITCAVGWLGAVVAYLALALAGLAGQDPQTVRAAYLSMEMIGWYVIVPCSLGALLTGLVGSLGTDWGLFRHYWVLAKLLLTSGGTLVLLVHMQTVSRVARLAAGAALYSPGFETLQLQLVLHAAGGLLVLLAATVLSVYKPWGRTGYGRPAQQERRKVVQPISLRPKAPATDRAAATRGSIAAPRTSQRQYVLLGVAGLVLLIVLHLVVLRLAGGGFPGH